MIKSCMSSCLNSGIICIFKTPLFSKSIHFYMLTFYFWCWSKIPNVKSCILVLKAALRTARLVMLGVVESGCSVAAVSAVMNDNPADYLLREQSWAQSNSLLKYKTLGQRLSNTLCFKQWNKHFFQVFWFKFCILIKTIDNTLFLFEKAIILLLIDIKEWQSYWKRNSTLVFWT